MLYLIIKDAFLVLGRAVILFKKDNLIMLQQLLLPSSFAVFE
jgi:hypothetical protein